MDKMIDATIASINATGIAAPLVFVLCVGCLAMAATCRRLFALYSAAMEARVTEKDATVKAVSEVKDAMNRLADAFRAGAK